MMVGKLGRPSRGGDLGSGRLVALGLVVSMVSFAGFRVTTDTKPRPPASSRFEGVVSASLPSPIPAVLLRRLAATDPILEPPAMGSITLADPPRAVEEHSSNALAVVADGRAPAEVGPSRRIVEGVVEVSFYASAARADVPDETIAQAAEVLGWDLDFGKLQAGSTFSIQFEQRRSPASGETLPGRLLSVRIVEVGGELHEGIWFQQPGEKVGGFYTSKGQALSRDYLRYPVSFTRISSGFADARVHPVLNFTRPHYGVDLAAPAGTPVHAISDGNVELAAWQGGYGRWVQIRHDDTFESGYGHLSRIAPDIRPGCAVRKGDVIGYVGSTGITTGPHLHFAIYKNGKYIDPLSAEAPRSRSLAGSSAERFRDQVRKVEAAYAAAGRAGGDLVLVATAGAATGVLDGTAARWDSASASIGR